MAKSNNSASAEFLNPYTPGVNYKQFLAAIPEGTSVEDYCKGNLTADEIKHIVSDLKHYEANAKARAEAQEKLNK